MCSDPYQVVCGLKVIVLCDVAGSKQLTAAIDHTGDVYNDIGAAFERQVRTSLFSGLRQQPLTIQGMCTMTSVLPSSGR